MHHFSSNGIDIAYLDIGAGDPVLLIHGLASSSHINWVATGWTQALTDDGRRAVAMDVRGHGESAKLYEPAAYDLRLSAADAANLITHLALGRTDVIGYSMGVRVAAALVRDRPELVRSLVLGGMGDALITGAPDRDAIAEAMEADNIHAANPVGRGHRAFAERSGGDLKALAACTRAPNATVAPEALAAIAVPVLIAIGSKDEIARPLSALTAIIPGVEVLDIVGRDHMTASGDPQFKAGVLDFLKRRP